MKMKIKLLSLLLLVAAFSISGCKEEDDDTDNGVPANTLVVNGTDISLPLVTCSQYSSSYDLKFTATDIAQTHLLEIFIDDYPTVTTTYAISSGGSSAEAWGSYTVNGAVEYDTESGSITVTPRGNDSFTFTFNDIVSESNNSVQAILSFNGTCD